MTKPNNLKKRLKNLEEQVANNIEYEMKVFESGWSTDFGSPEEQNASIKKQNDEYLRNRVTDPTKKVVALNVIYGLLVGGKDGQDVIQFRNHQYVTDGKKYRRLD
jgi:hypothetical protein